MKKIILKVLVAVVIIAALLSCKQDTRTFRTSYYREDAGRTGFSHETPLRSFSRVSQKINLGNQIYSSMMMDESYLYVNTVDAGYVLRKDNFETVWKYQKKSIVVSPPITEKANLYVTDLDGGVTAMVKDNGKTVWRMSVEGNIYGSVLIETADHQLHFATSAYPDTLKMGCYYQVETSRGLIKKKIPLPDNVMSSPASSGDYIVFYTHTGILLCFDIHSASLLWTYDVNPNNTYKDLRYEYMSTPTIHKGYVFVTDPAGLVHAVDLSSGRSVWSVAINSYTDVSPAVDDNNIYFGAENGAFYCLDLHTGDTKWIFTGAGSRVTTGALLTSTIVYFGTDKGRLIALDTQSGQLIWDFQIEYPEDITPYMDKDAEPDPNAPPPVVQLCITADPLLFERRIIIGCFDYNLYVLE